MDKFERVLRTIRLTFETDDGTYQREHSYIERSDTDLAGQRWWAIMDAAGSGNYPWVKVSDSRWLHRDHVKSFTVENL